MSDTTDVTLPGLDCGLCGYRTCEQLSAQLASKPELLKRCIPLQNNLRPVKLAPKQASAGQAALPQVAEACAGCRTASPRRADAVPWHDHLGRQFDFFLEHFPNEPGPREIILPHNPMITRELEIQVGDLLIGRPLGMSCGCPITHCGVATSVDRRNGVIVWCVTGPLGPRQKGFKDLGYYIAEGYEGLVRETRSELKVGMRYYFQPRLCMLQWRHSGLLNYLSRNQDHYQVRLEGLWIG